MIRTIIFDFGNVIGFFDHRRATDRLADACGATSDEVWDVLMNPTLEDDYEAGRITTGEVVARLRRHFDFSCDDAAIERAAGEIFWPNAEVAALIPRLRPAYRLLLGSNTCEVHSRRFREQFADTLAHFDALILSHEIGARKPNPGFFEECINRSGGPPGAAVFIDDLVPNVDGARACGLHGIVYRGFDGLVRDLRALDIDISGESATK